METTSMVHTEVKRMPEEEREEESRGGEQRRRVEEKMKAVCLGMYPLPS